jgi:hypothetical protein
MKQLQTDIIVDDCDKVRVARVSWYVSEKRQVRHSYINAETGSTVTIVLANYVMEDFTTMFDHIDRNPLNNRRSNLRPCTYSQNAANRSKMLGTTSKFRGISFNTRSKKWKAKITIYGRIIHLGTFIMQEDAARAYDRAALELFKEFANLNFK